MVTNFRRNYYELAEVFYDCHAFRNFYSRAFARLERTGLNREPQASSPPRIPTSPAPTHISLCCAPLLVFTTRCSASPFSLIPVPVADTMPSTSPFGRRAGGRPRPWRGLAAIAAVTAVMMTAGAVVGLLLRGGGALGLGDGASFILGGLGKTALGLWLGGGGKGTSGRGGGPYADFQTLPSGLRIKDGTWSGARGWQWAREALVSRGKRRGRGSSSWGGTVAVCLGGSARVRRVLRTTVASWLLVLFPGGSSTICDGSR